MVNVWGVWYPLLLLLPSARMVAKRIPVSRSVTTLMLCIFFAVHPLIILLLKLMFHPITFVVFGYTAACLGHVRGKVIIPVLIAWSTIWPISHG